MNRLCEHQVRLARNSLLRVEHQVRLEVKQIQFRGNFGVKKCPRNTVLDSEQIRRTSLQVRLSAGPQSLRV